MLFRWEEQSHQWLMVLILASSAVIAIVINQSNMSGSKKLKLFRFIKRFTKFFLLPAAVYMLVIQIIALSNENYISVESSSWRFSIAFGEVCILLLIFTRILPLTNEGIAEMKRKSITASKYQRIFMKLRSSFMAMMVVIIFSFWLNYMFKS